jgi:hypothetical protein
MIEAKPKHKHAFYLHRRLHILLLVWLVVTFLAAFYPLIWLVPPYIQLTPFIYVLASLGWMPFVFQHIRRHGWRWLTVLLMVGCLAGTVVVTHSVFNLNYPDQCFQLDKDIHHWRCSLGMGSGDDEYWNFNEYIFTPNFPLGFKSGDGYCCLGAF